MMVTKSNLLAGAAARNQSVQLSHVPDFYNRYPGEVVCFYTRVLLGKTLPGGVLSVALPVGLELIDHTASVAGVARSAFVRDLEAGQVVDWHLDPGAEPGGCLEVETRARVLPSFKQVYLVGVADLRDAQGGLVATENARVAVHPSGSYMNHLPEIYHGSDFLGRFLMLFESFWKPINQQIDQIDAYFDPDLTPPTFLPWLASWLGVVWDETLPDDRKRALLRAAISLYQRQGTRGALRDYLRIYTAGEVEIIEHRALNFTLGAENRLGAAVALGKHNLPHTFSVHVEVSEQEASRMGASDSPRNHSAYRRKLEEMIEMRKPAHTAFRLNLIVGNPGKLEPQIDRMAGKES